MKIITRAKFGLVSLFALKNEEEEKTNMLGPS